MFACSTLLNLQKVLLRMAPYLPRTSIKFYMQKHFDGGHVVRKNSCESVTELKYTQTDTKAQENT